MFASGFSWFRTIPWFDHDEPLVQAGLDQPVLPGHEVPNMAVYGHAWLAVAVLIVLALMGRMALARAQARPGLEKYFPAEQPTVLTVAEVLADGLRGILGDMLDKTDVRRFFPLVAGLFTYIFACNIQAIFPGFLPPTDTVTSNFGMALIVFLTFNYVGLSRDFWGYLRHMAGPSLALAPFLFLVELLSLLIRPYSLTLRLGANMFGDHQVFSTVAGLAPYPPLLVPLLALAMLVSGIQAFVFSLLTVIYVSLALPHHDHAEHDGEHGGHDPGHDHNHGAAPAAASH